MNRFGRWNRLRWIRCSAAKINRRPLRSTAWCRRPAGTHCRPRRSRCIIGKDTRRIFFCSLTSLVMPLTAAIRRRSPVKSGTFYHSAARVIAITGWHEGCSLTVEEGANQKEKSHGERSRTCNHSRRLFSIDRTLGRGSPAGCTARGDPATTVTQRCNPMTAPMKGAVVSEVRRPCHVFQRLPSDSSDGCR